MSTPTSFQYRAILILIILLAFSIRLSSLEISPLWFDELLEFWTVTAPLENLLETVNKSIIDPPVYSLLLHFWINLGKDEFTLRILSTFASLLTIAIGFALGKHVHSWQVGVIVALLFSLTAPQIRFAQEVGQYALLQFILLGNLLATAYVRKHGQWKYWLLWLSTGLLCVYSYYGSVLIISPIAAVVFLEHVAKKNKAQLIKQTITASLFAIAVLILIVFWLPSQIQAVYPTNIFSDSSNTSLLTTGLSYFIRTKAVLAYQLIGRLVEPNLWANLQSTAWGLVTLSLLFCVYSLKKSPKHLYIVIWLIASWCVYYFAGWAGVYPYGGTRHSLILTPLLIIAISIGIRTVWETQRLAGLTILLAMLIVAGQAPGEGAEDLRTIAEHYVTKRQENTPTYVYYGAVPGFRYQLMLLNDTGEDLSPVWFRHCWAGQPHTYCSEDNIFYGRWARDWMPHEKSQEILSVVGETADTGFWLIFAHVLDTEQDEVLSGLDSYVIVDTIEADGARAYWFQER